MRFHNVGAHGGNNELKRYGALYEQCTRRNYIMLTDHN